MRRNPRLLFLSSLLGVLLAGAVVPGLAAAQVATPPTVSAGADATLYEATENMRLVGGTFKFRRATAELMGVAHRGSPLCPTSVPGTGDCTINVTGKDDVDLATGQGSLGGTFTTVIQDTSIDSPEVVVMKGKFLGRIDFSPALFQGVPIGSLSAVLVVDGGGTFPFTGIFRVPVSSVQVPLTLPNPCPTQPCAVYFTGSGFIPLQPNEFAAGYPMVRMEITFTQ